MGECGCGGDQPEVRIEGADGVHYGVGIYDGCQYCSLGVYVDLYAYDDEFADMFLNHLDPVAVPRYGAESPNGKLSIPLLDPEHLLAALQEQGAEIGEDFGLGVQEVRWAIQDAIHKTQNEHNERASERASTKGSPTEASNG